MFALHDPATAPATVPAAPPVLAPREPCGRWATARAPVAPVAPVALALNPTQGTRRRPSRVPTPVGLNCGPWAAGWGSAGRRATESCDLFLKIRQPGLAHHLSHLRSLSPVELLSASLPVYLVLRGGDGRRATGRVGVPTAKLRGGWAVDLVAPTRSIHRPVKSIACQ